MVKIKKEIHKIWTELEGNKYGMPHLVGKYQYIYSSEKGEISFVKFINYFSAGS